jgi:hypothetical protein
MEEETISQKTGKVGRPKVSSSAQKELDKMGEQFDQFDAGVKALTLDAMNNAPKHEVEQQTRLSDREIAKSKDIYLKPHRTIGCKEKFNETYREPWDFAKEYVQFIAENKEIIGEDIQLWTKPFAGIPAEEWKVPTNKPIWGPRYLAEQIKRKSYHRLVMTNTITENSGTGQFYGSMASDSVIQRLDAIPVNSRKSVFMGAGGF